MNEETIGQLHDSIEPAGHTHRRAFRLTRREVPAIEDVCAEPSCDRPSEDDWGFCDLHWAKREGQR